jgi:hypothetical protein
MPSCRANQQRDLQTNVHDVRIVLMGENLPSSDPNIEFARCVSAAVEHIKWQFQDPLRSWLKTDLIPPFLEHFSFRFGNQLFFVLCEDVSGEENFPSSRETLLNLAIVSRGNPCLMPMERIQDSWQPSEAGWGLLDLRTGEYVNPLNMVTDERIEMTDYEIYSAAIEYLKESYLSSGNQVIFANCNPRMDPGFWYTDSEGTKTITVRAVRYPVLYADLPDNWPAICTEAAHRSMSGTFLSIGFMNCKEPDGPLWRDEPFNIYVDYHTHDRELSGSLTKYSEGTVKYYASRKDEQILYDCANCNELPVDSRTILKMEAQRRGLHLPIESIVILNKTSERNDITRDSSQGLFSLFENHPVVSGIMLIITFRIIYKFIYPLF